MRTCGLFLAGLFLAAALSAQIPVASYSPEYINPIGLPGLALWLRASDVCTSNGATVTTWTDKSGHGANFTGSGVSAPTCVLSGIGGTPSLAFNGSQFMTGTFNFAANYFTVFVVMKETAALTDYLGIFAENNGAANGYMSALTIGPVSAGSQLGTSVSGVTFVAGTTGPFMAANTPYVLTARSSGYQAANHIDTLQSLVITALRQNGVGYSSTGNYYAVMQNGSIQPATQSIIGCAVTTPANCVTAQISEIIVCAGSSGELSMDTISAVESYLGNKYGISIASQPPLNYAQHFDGWSSPYYPGTPVLQPGTGSAWDAGGAAGNIVWEPSLNEYVIAYHGVNSGGIVGGCGIATSATVAGFPYTKYGTELIAPTPSTWYSGYVSGCRYFKDPNWVSGPGPYYIYFFSGQGTGVYEAAPAYIGAAYASTLTGPYTVCGANTPLISTGTTGSWDDTILYRPFVFFYNGLYYLFYNAKGSTEQIGYATASSPCGTWTKYSGNPVVTTLAGSLYSARIGDPTVFQPDPSQAHWVMSYWGSDNNTVGIGLLADSSNLSTWTPYPQNFVQVMTQPNWVRPSIFPMPGGWGSTADNGTATYYQTLMRGPFGHYTGVTWGSITQAQWSMTQSQWGSIIQ